MKQFDFQTQLKKGKAGEELFLKYHPDIRPLDGRKGDFIGFTGRKIELKTDSRTVLQTGNFFIEYQRDEKGNPGGPWQAAVHEVHYFVYLFADGTIYWFEVAPLLAYLECNLHEFKKRRVFNKGWTATGFLVPRAALEALIIKKENIYERESLLSGHQTRQSNN